MYDYLLVGHCKYSCLVLFLSYLALNNIATLQFRLGVTGDRWKWHHLMDRILFFHSNYRVSFPR